MGSILRSTDGVGKFEMPREGIVVVTFDDGKTTAAKIVKALTTGSFTVKGKPVYVEPSASAQQGASPGSSTQSFPGLPLYITSPDSSGTMSR
jgi:hypothetical protein